MSGMDLAARIETRRFVGREFLLWLWLESELFEGTLKTKAHGDIGFWLERKLVLSRAKEVTQIKGKSPASAREAKEALRVGKLPERAGIHITLGDRDFVFDLRADTMAIAALSLPAVLGATDDDDDKKVMRFDDSPKARKKKAVNHGVDADDEAREVFYERMHLTAEIESILEALFAEFLALRLHDGWPDVVVPVLARWSAGLDVDADRYAAARKKALGGKSR